MTDDINLDPDRATTAGHALAATADHIGRVRETRGGDIEQAHNAAPWGDDDLGRAFALGKSGQDGYLASAEQLLQTWQAAAEAAAQLGTGITTAAAEHVAADHMRGRRFQQIRELPL